MCRARAFTLLEMMIVIAVLCVLALLVLPNLWSAQSLSQNTTTAASLATVRDAIAGSAAAPGYVGDVGSLPTTLKDLFVMPTSIAPFNPQTARGWRGPYLSSSTIPYVIDAQHNFTTAYGQPGDPAPADAWNHSLVLQIPTAATTAADQKTFARLVSAGPDGIIQTPADVLYPDPAGRGDDQVLFLFRPDVAP